MQKTLTFKQLKQLNSELQHIDSSLRAERVIKDSVQADEDIVAIHRYHAGDVQIYMGEQLFLTLTDIIPFDSTLGLTPVLDLRVSTFTKGNLPEVIDILNLCSRYLLDGKKRKHISTVKRGVKL